MSALGQKLPRRARVVTSALAPKAAATVAIGVSTKGHKRTSSILWRAHRFWYEWKM
jgi:hypothetical protein